MSNKCAMTGPKIIEDVCLHFSMMVTTAVVIYNAMNSDEFYESLFTYGFIGLFAWAFMWLALKGLAFGLVYIIKMVHKVDLKH